MRTLIIAPNWIGDALMAQPLLALLRRADPGQTIVAMAPSWVAPVLEAMPEVDRVIPTALAHGTLQWRARLAFARQLRRERYDRVFVLPNSLKSALVPWLAGIPERIGYRGEARYGLLNRRLAPPDPAMPMVARYAALAGLLIGALPDTLPEPRLTLPQDQIAPVLQKFGLDVSRPLIALCPGAEYGPAKRWPVAHFARLANQIHETDPTSQVILLGGPGDRADAEAICAAAHAATDASIDASTNTSGKASTDVRTDASADAVPTIRQLAGSTSLPEALALIAASSAVVSNDSGLMHVAAALGKPQVALFGSSDPRHTPPLSAKAQILWLQLECSPCFERVCPLGHLRCLNELTPDLAAAALRSALAGARQGDESRNDHGAHAKEPV